MRERNKEKEEEEERKERIGKINTCGKTKSL